MILYELEHSLSIQSVTAAYETHSMFSFSLMLVLPATQRAHATKRAGASPASSHSHLRLTRVRLVAGLKVVRSLDSSLEECHLDATVLASGSSVAVGKGKSKLVLDVVCLV